MALRFNPVAIPDAATYTVKDYNSGILHILPDLTADIAISLPTAKKGLSYRFMYAGAAADAQDWLINTGSDTNFYKGGAVQLLTGAGDAVDEVIPVRSDGDSNSKLTVLTPDVGTWLELHCDGTNWYVNGYVVSTSASAVAFANQA